MTDPHDPWAELANSLGASPEPQQPPPLPPPLPSESVPRGRGRRRNADAEGGEAPRRRRREPKPAADVPVDPFLVGLDPDLPTEAVGESTEPLGPDGEPRKRRRRRGRRKGAPAEAGVTPEGVAAPVETAEDDGEEVDLAPIETYSSLNIPTWQQLIDGLYKP